MILFKMSRKNNPDLSAGPFSYLVTDAHSCTQQGSFVIPVVSDINCAISVSIDPTIPGQPVNTIFTGYGTQVATLTGIVNSGTGPYTYNWVVPLLVVLLQ
jgi:hypothetical protein